MELAKSTKTGDLIKAWKALLRGDYTQNITVMHALRMAPSGLQSLSAARLDGGTFSATSALQAEYLSSCFGGFAESSGSFGCCGTA